MKTIKAVHYSIIQNSNNNAGDNLLFESVRKIIEHFSDIEIEWKVKSMWDLTSSSQINSDDCDFVLFGGGGIILPDQTGASNINDTGWQIDISSDDYKNINVPYFATAIGYNWFRNCSINPSKISNNLDSFIKNSKFVGFRNNGSLKSVEHITKSKYDNVGILPCPTTLLSEFYFDSSSYIEKNDSSNFNVAINIGCDRLDQRNVNLKDFSILNDSIKWMVENGYSVTYLSHKDIDLDILDYLNVDNVENISRFTIDELLKKYSEFDCVFGGRGHSLMIPFGLNIPIVSITTHDKQKFFMDDAGLHQCNLELLEHTSDSILSFVKNLEKNISYQKKLNYEYQKNGYKLWKEFVNHLHSSI